MKKLSIYTDVYKTIKNKRMQLGISQVEMAKKLKMQQAGYSLLEKGEIKLTHERMVDISIIFDVPVSYFVDKQVQQLIDSLLERLEDLNALHAQSSFVADLPDLPDNKQETIEYYQKKDADNAKLILSLERQADALRKLSDYQHGELENAKEIMKMIVGNSKTAKSVKPAKLKVERFLKKQKLLPKAK